MEGTVYRTRNVMLLTAVSMAVVVAGALSLVPSRRFRRWLDRTAPGVFAALDEIA